MTTTTPLSTTARRARDKDMRAVEEILGTLAPRWSAWALLTLHSTGPQRPVEIQRSLPMPSPTALHTRLTALHEAGLVDRRAKHEHHVIYGLSDRGRRLIPALDTLASWAKRHPMAGGEAGPLAYAERIEEALLQLGARHTTPVLWTLREHGPVRVRDLHKTVVPHLAQPTVSLKLSRIAEDGLIERTHDAPRAPYRLTEVSRDLAKSFAALSAWAAGRTPSGNDPHPVWNPAPARGRTTPKAPANRQAAVRATAAQPAPAARARTAAPRPAGTAPSWGSQLFSHSGPYHTAPVQQGGRTR